MGDLTQNFSRSEFRCKGDNKTDDISLLLVDLMQELREDLGQVTITSGCRNPVYNKQVGGAPQSRHTYPFYDACDFTVKGVDPQDVQEYLLNKYPDQYGIGRYNTFTHFDVRPDKARWDFR